MYDNNGQKQYEFSPWSNGLKDFKIQNRNRMCDSILVKFKVNNKRTKNQMIYKKKTFTLQYRDAWQNQYFYPPALYSSTQTRGHLKAKVTVRQFSGYRKIKSI